VSSIGPWTLNKPHHLLNSSITIIISLLTSIVILIFMYTWLSVFTNSCKTSELVIYFTTS
jgi:hypothetical protein